MSYSGGVGRVTITWEGPAADPDPAATQYWLYATPVVSSRRRLLGEGKTAFAELRPTSGGGALAPAGGSGSFASPFSAVVSIPGGLGMPACMSWAPADCLHTPPCDAQPRSRKTHTRSVGSKAT